MIKYDLNDRVAVVTGGAQGFGLAITERFIEAGAKVVIWDIDEEAIKNALDKVNSENLSHQIVDVSNFENISKSLSETESKHGKIDIFVNNAGIAGLTAAVTGTEITLTYEPTAASWGLTLAEGTGALAALGFTAGTVSPAADPASRDYYDVWSNVTDDRKLSMQMTQVINYFQGLGYSIVQKQNVTTGNTFQWEVYW